MLIKMTVRGIALDPITNMPIIILKDVDERKALPIWVGIFEANAIALELEKVSTPRPMTHDLLKSVLEGLGVTVRQVIVNDLKDNTFFAVIELNRDGTVINIDARPSDAIALELEKVSTPRPMTHDLLKSVLEGLGVTVRQVIVNDLKDNTFFAVIELNRDGTVINVDARPSDAIALALRVNAPIFVTEKVVSQAKSVEISEEKEETDKWREWLENLKPEDFGKYRM